MHEITRTIIGCPGCGVALDVSEMAPFAEVECPQCGTNTRVKCAFGPYLLVRCHAMGGMSMVFAARDRTLDREVALKILSEEYSADETRIRAFEKEARITASLSHPNIVRVFTTGRAFDRLYIAMEMVSGGNLEELITRHGKIPEKEVLRIALDVAEGLKAAHAAGLVHRDVKPGNILIDAAGRAKLVDFGLAIITHGGILSEAEYWATPYYAPPEAVEGKDEDFRSDIYAFGATLYHALCGRPPCEETSMSADVLLEAKKRVSPPDPAADMISEASCRLVAKAMAYDASSRFSSYQEMTAAIKAALGDSGIMEETGAGDSRRRRGGFPKLAMVAAAVLLSAVALVFAVMQMGEKERVADRPVAGGEVAPELPAEIHDTAELGQLYQSARALLESRDYEAAEVQFAELFNDARLHEPTHSWVGLEAVICAFLDARAEDAMKKAEVLETHLQGLTEHHPLKSDPWGALLGGLEKPAPLAAPPDAANASGVTAAMLAGLKNWDQGMLKEAAACFEIAAAARLDETEAWASIYQKIAADHLHDFQLLSTPLFHEIPADQAACEAAISRLDETLALLKTRGRARFNVRSWQTDIERRARLLAASEN